MIGDQGSSLGGSRVHGIRVRRLRLHGEDRAYDVDFRGPDDSPRPLSVIAGAFSTGKTTILEFVDYCLGASDHPRHPEIMPKVRGATLEVDLSGSPYLIERTVGEPSTFAYICAGRLDEAGATPPQRRPLRPAGHPDSLSSLLLSHCKLEGVRLRDTLTNDESDTDPLSFRDLMWLCFLPNERLDDKNLLFENTPMKHLKLRQVVDVVFDVHDDHSVELGRRIRALEADLAATRIAHRVTEQIVDEQRLGGREDLEAMHRGAKTELSESAQAMADLDARARADTDFASELRERHRAAAHEARRAAALLHDRESQVQRMTSLRTTYADDVSKLTMLIEADRLFEPMRTSAGPLDVSAELRSARARLHELTEYLADLAREVPRLRPAVERAVEAEARCAADVDSVTAHAVTPYLAQRDALARRREDASAALQQATSGLRLIHSLERRAAEIDRQEALLATLREELSDAGAQSSQADRSVVVRRVSDRYREILTEWRYPKIADAYVADDLTPHMRGKPYAAASSGGRTLIALAWQLALFEIAWETRSSHPGFLLLDSPQKNLGQTAGRSADLAGSATIDSIYRHLERWLAGKGTGAQIVVADNTPPPAAAADVIVRFSRRPDQPPYGLIDDETT